MRSKETVQPHEAWIRIAELFPFRTSGTLSETALRHISGKDNTIALFATRTKHLAIHKEAAGSHYAGNTLPETGITIPLYLYPESRGQHTLSLFDQKEALPRIPNMNGKALHRIAAHLGLEFTFEKAASSLTGTFTPTDLLNYIYGVLHTPECTQDLQYTWKSQLPAVPYPRHAKHFLQMAGLGAELRQVHALESPAVKQYITSYPEEGDNKVRKVLYAEGSVFINDLQHFANVPEKVWDFTTGKLFPARQWLTDRLQKALSFDDIFHYQKIIAAIHETIRLTEQAPSPLLTMNSVILGYHGRFNPANRTLYDLQKLPA